MSEAIWLWESAQVYCLHLLPLFYLNWWQGFPFRPDSAMEPFLTSLTLASWGAIDAKKYLYWYFKSPVWDSPGLWSIQHWVWVLSKVSQKSRKLGIAWGEEVGHWDLLLGKARLEKRKDTAPSFTVLLFMCTHEIQQFQTWFKSLLPNYLHISYLPPWFWVLGSYGISCK